MTGLAKKSLFDMLGERLLGATVLDLYCGTGTLGLEALSRGAASCTFADRDRRSLARLRRNIEAVAAADRCEILQGDVMSRLPRWLAALDRKVDIAFVDPPYSQVRRWNWQKAIDRIFVPLAGRLTREGTAVLRVPAKVHVPQPLGPLRAHRTRSFGQMMLMLLKPAGKDG